MGKTRERQRLLQFLYDAYFDDTRQSENNIEEIAFQLNPEINRERLKIYLIEFLENGWIEWDKERPKAYKITDKGILRYRSSSWSSISMTHKLVIITIVITTILGLLNLVYCTCT